ncbi:MAG: heme-dependent peroxidase [Acidobacteria bacterium]|jgi:peroxiredoxin|nr:heme-dependent peroxidase [Bryobacteraceae bacterium CoA2 C42]MCA2965349.1 heme-dependent peroxidase [Acidobacteriaceae bacterium]
MSEPTANSLPAALPAVPLTIEGAWVLHLMYRIDRGKWNALTNLSRRDLLREFADDLRQTQSREDGQTAVYAMVGKGDLMIICFRESLAALQEAQRDFLRNSLAGYLTPVADYTSVIELGLYESSVKTFRALEEKGLAPHGELWQAAVQETLERQAEAMAPRLYPRLPESQYVCFYPMDRLRGEAKNWYTVPIEERARMMHEHGLVGRRYAGTVKQIITGSIGLDDWEWGVDLFSDDPVVFKKLIYEMRFDEVSAVYAKFGKFYVGVRCAPAELEERLLG